MPASAIRNAMTVDVEDYFHAAAMGDCLPRSRWSSQQSRIEASVERVLALLAGRDVHATFFVLGWIARRHPQLVRGIVAAGHELASHGYSRHGAGRLNRVQFTRDIVRSKGVLEDAAGQAVLGYRAPDYSLAPPCRWALDALFRQGYRYSSSSYPIGAADAGDPLASRFATFPSGAAGIMELPLSTARLFGRNIPAAGAHHFRLYPYRLSRWLLQRINGRERQAAIFHFRPWELDLGQPRQAGLGLGAQVLHYTNIARMEARLQALSADFQWDRIDQIFPVLPSSSAVLHSE